MSRRDQYEKLTEELVTPIIQRGGFELVDVEYVKEAGEWYLRIYADKEGGIDIVDCEAISRELSELLDVKDFIEDAYILEVSSPGLLRPLKKDKDFDRQMGKPVEIKTFKAIDGEKEFVGELTAYDAASVTIAYDDKEATINRKEISMIRPYIEF